LQNVVVNNDISNVEVEVEVMGEVEFANNGEQIEPEIVIDRKEKSFFSQASGIGADMSGECYALTSEVSIMDEARK